MGGHTYSSFSRSTRADSLGYSTKSAEELFGRRMHESMDPKTISLRECRDSAEHPNSFPIVLVFDVTGSMKRIPHYFIKEGLPKLIEKIQKAGFQDPSILLMAVGDCKSDRAPLQIGQFESGDEQLDMWLQRIWPEGNGGGNGGESYSLPWFFSKYIVADHFEKRNGKGLMITIGDEPCHDLITSRQLSEIFQNIGTEKDYTSKELLELASKNFDVYHLNMLEGTDGNSSVNFWKNLLGEHCINVSDHTKAPEIIAQLVIDKTKNLVSGQYIVSNPTIPSDYATVTDTEEIIL